MDRKLVFAVALILALIGTPNIAFRVQKVEATVTIYIKADGSVDPETASISRVDNVVYSFEDNINDSIVVQRDNIVIDGANFRLQGTGVDQSKGVDLSDRTNVTLKSVEVTDFYFGIFLYFSCDNTVTGSNASNNTWGAFLADSCDNALTGNTFLNNEYGIYFHSSNNNTLTGNNASNNTYGILLDGSTNNTFTCNTVSNNEYGFYFRSSLRLSKNTVFHNVFVDNKEPARIGSLFTNVWDDGYPSGGNYWSDYDGTDGNSDGIGDTPYIIDMNNQDDYPLMEPWRPPSSILGDLNGDGIVDIFDVVTISLAFGSTPLDSSWNRAADLNYDDAVDIFDIVLLAQNFGKTA